MTEPGGPLRWNVRSNSPFGRKQRTRNVSRTVRAQLYWALHYYSLWQVETQSRLTIRTVDGRYFEVRGGVLASVYLWRGAPLSYGPQRGSATGRVTVATLIAALSVYSLL